MKHKAHLIRIASAFIAVFFVSLVSAWGMEMHSLVDQTGRQIRVPIKPQRVVALAPSITEIIYALECQDRLKGATRFSDYPEAAEAIPRVGSYVYLDLEKIVALNPAVCIAIKDGNPRSVIDRLEALDIPVFAVNPRGLDTVMRAIDHIGQLMGAEKRADEIIADMAARIAKVESKVAQTEKRPLVFFQIGIAPIVSAGSDTFIHELIVKAGGINMAGQYTSYPRFSREEVLERAPDILIITSMARKEVFDRVKAEWEKWEQIPAVAKDRVYLVDSNLFDRPTPRLVDALERLVKLIHPEM